MTSVVRLVISSLNFNLPRRSSRDSVTRLGTSEVVSRAKIKSVKVMGILVSGFIVCWTPYYVMSLWWWIDQESAEKFDYKLQKLLWAFACANNCLNPLLYKMMGQKSK